MPTVTHIMNYIELYDSIQATGTWDSVAQAIEQGAVYVESGTPVNGLMYIKGGNGAPVIDFAKAALEVAKEPSIIAQAWSIGTAAVTAAIKSGKVALMGLATIPVPTAIAAASPLAGIVIGEELWRNNPNLWTKLSAAALPFCYEENKVRAFVDFTVDSLGHVNPIILIETAFIRALAQLFKDEDIHPVPYEVITSPYGNAVLSPAPDVIPMTDPDGNHYEKWSGGGYYIGFVSDDGTWTGTYGIGETRYRTNYYGGTYTTLGNGWMFPGDLRTDLAAQYGIPQSGYTWSQLKDIINNQTSTEVIPATAGVSAPTAPVEPIVWPDTPIIIVPDPLGPDYQPIPVTPITPLPLPAPEPTPLLPEHVPDPTPAQPEEWPEEEPWPTVIPFPVPDPDPSTEPGPDPDWPEVMPWPLPDNPPEEWPKTPDDWPYPFPEEVPWPSKPSQWPEEVPWPITPPEWWPETIPWPVDPESWPEEVPWPVPWPQEWPTYPPTWPEPFPEELPWPTKPEEWPEEVPWPVTPPDWWPDGTPWPVDPQSWPEEVPWPLPPPWPIPWPDTQPYPYPFPYPLPSPDPYPDPEKIEDPETQVDPYIDPWPYPWPDPYPDPDPKPDPIQDPSRPYPFPDPDPKPYPDPDPDPKPDPTKDPWPPTPSDGEPDPPVPPVIPLPFSSATGLISVYHPTQGELLSFANWLWVTWQDATIDKIWNNPFDGVISLFELYCTPTDVGRKNIRSGFLDSGVSSETISRYTEINCGSIGVPEYFGNYLDYAPYSKCHIYLPFIGIVELNVDDIVGHGVNVTYRVDEYNGSCIAMITVAKSTTVNGSSVDYSTIMYQFSGNCAVELPLSGGSQAAIKAGMIEAAAWGIGSVIGGIMNGSSLGEIGSGMAYGVASAVHSVVSAKSSVQHSGSFGSSYGAMGAKRPFIIVSRPKQIQVPNYNELYGYQSHKMVKIGECSGYLRCREVHVISSTASDEEKSLIEQLLKSGVYIS